MIFNRSRQGLFQPLGRYTAPSAYHWVIVGNCSSATIDFYFRSRKTWLTSYIELDTGDEALLTQLLSRVPEGALVILSRDVPIEWLQGIMAITDRLSSVVWFMDDDIPGVAQDKTLPSAYRKRLSSWYNKVYPLLRKLCDKVWVSTPYLAQKYNLPESSVLPPIEPAYPVSQPLVRCFYHGSSSHTQEWGFVREVVKLVQARNPHTWFELIGDHGLYRQFRGIPRISILHPMPWPDYLAMTSSRTMDIGLAPLMDTPFNLARSHTKFLDITRQKAVGIYSERFPHAQAIEEAGAGITLPDNSALWVTGIEALLNKNRGILLNRAQALVTAWHNECNALPHERET